MQWSITHTSKAANNYFATAWFSHEVHVFTLIISVYKNLSTKYLPGYEMHCYYIR